MNLGALDGTVDLLPNPSTSGWTKRLPTDDGQESDQIFAFDGRSTSVEIPRNRVNPYLGDQFTISTWMKHESEMEKEEANHDGRTGKGQSGSKGHILCHSDGEGELSIDCEPQMMLRCLTLTTPVISLLVL